MKFITGIKQIQPNNFLCRLIGHSWRYKDYTNWMQVNGDDYPFKASRNCSRCKQNEYYYSDWQSEIQNFTHDVERDSQAVKQL
jgi:hypothetical protein